MFMCVPYTVQVAVDNQENLLTLAYMFYVACVQLTVERKCDGKLTIDTLASMVALDNKELSRTTQQC